MAWVAIDPGAGDMKLVIKCDQAENVLCQQIPGCNYEEKTGLWKVALTWPAYVAFKEVWKHQPVIEQPALIDWAASAWNDVQIAYGLRAAMDTQYDPLAAFLDEEDRLTPPVQFEDGTRMPRTLFGYQRAGVAWLATQKRTILGDPQGNGKTPQVIRAIQWLKQTGQAPGPALVICTDAMLMDWKDELAVWAPELDVSAVRGTALKRRAALEPGHDVYLVSWSALRFHTRLAAYPGKAFVKCDEHGGHTGKTAAQCEVHEKELNVLPFSIVAADEAHRMKDATTKQTRAAWWMMHQPSGAECARHSHAEYAWPVTGTPVADSISDIWSIAHGIDARAFPAKGRFLDLYAMVSLDWHRGREVLDIKPESAPSFHATIQPLIRRIPKEAARPHQPPRMPPVFRHPEMEPAQARAYRAIAKEAMADLKGSLVVTGNDLVKFTRLCQLASASIETSDGEDPWGFTRQLVTLCSPSNKVTDLMDFIADEPGQLVVAVNSPKLIELAGARLSAEKITWGKITGSESTDAKHEVTKWFQQGQFRVVFITKAGAESITLTAAPCIYFMQPEPSFLAREQKIGRVDRITQREPVRVVYSITPGTVEERLYQLGCQKEERANNVTRDADLLRWIIGGDEGAIRASDEAGAAV